MAKIDDALTKAKALIADAASRLDEIVTEEDAKVQIITRILTEVLGWRHSDISNERKHDNGYSDYIVSLSGHPAFLIEAKRRGGISIATSVTKRQHYKLSGAALRPAIEGIEQAASYAPSAGTPLAIITDGTRWIFFKPFVQGEDYKNKEAIVFPTFDAIIEGFAEFYELASSEGHEAGSYKSIFDKLHNNRLLLDRPISSVIGPEDIHPEHKHQIAFDIDKVFNSFFSELTGDDDPDLLVECFVETKESRIADFALEKLTINVLGNIDPDHASVDEGLRDLIRDRISDQQGDTVFIVGPSGSGKTTFLDRFFKKTLPRNTRERCVVVKIDALDATGSDSGNLVWITEAVIQCFEKQLFEGGYPKWDDLLGLYHLEYKRRSEGSDAQLYNQDKGAFKIKFGEYLDQQVETDREGYLRRLLTNVVMSRKRLPIFLIDNTDEFSMDFKQKIFQYFQAMRRHVGFCLLIFPVTDRSAWSFSRTEIFNIYSSRSYFLPTPSPREVFRKRVEFLKDKIEQRKKTRTGGGYSIGQGIRLSIDDLEAFAAAIEDIFVDQDYVSNKIGMLSNYNIRKTLSLAKRIITSAALDVEDLLKSYLLGQRSDLSHQKFINALILGDFNYFKKADNHYLFPVFDVDREIRQSPLIHLRLLSLLRAMHDKRSADEERYLTVASITQYFDAMGYAEVAVEKSLAAMLNSGLIEAYDPSIGQMTQVQKVAIAYSGITHLDLALFNPKFFEQMALTAAIADTEIVAQLRSEFFSHVAPATRHRRVRERFAKYLFDEDKVFGRVPDGPQYNVQRSLAADIQKFSDGTFDNAFLQRDSGGRSAETGLIAERVKAVVDWFDPLKGFGFATVEDRNERAYLHMSVLEQGGFEDLRDGDQLVCDLSRSTKGIAISKVHLSKSADATVAANAEARIVRVFETRGYGFVNVPELQDDAFFHLSVVPAPERERLSFGRKLRAEINADPKGRGYQVRRIISFEP